MLDIISSSVHIDIVTVLKCPSIWDLTSRFFCIFIYTEWKLPQEVVMQITELWFPVFQLNSLTNFSSLHNFSVNRPGFSCYYPIQNQVSSLPAHSPYQLLLYLQFHFCILCCSYTCSLYLFFLEDRLCLFSFFLKSHPFPEVTGWLFCSSPPFCSVALISSFASHYLKFTGTLWSLHLFPALFDADLLFAQLVINFSFMQGKSLVMSNIWLNIRSIKDPLFLHNWY